MGKATYIHGTESLEQARLIRLNELTNKGFIDFLEFEETSSVLEVGSGLEFWHKKLLVLSQRVKSSA